MPQRRAPISPHIQSLLAPALEASEDYGDYQIVPTLVGFILGAAFVYGSDLMLPHDTVALLAPKKVEPEIKSRVIKTPQKSNGVRQRKNGEFINRFV